MTKTTPALPAETGGTEVTRFNALRHGVLSRYTVLPWENADEYPLWSPRSPPNTHHKAQPMARRVIASSAASSRMSSSVSPSVARMASAR